MNIRSNKESFQRFYNIYCTRVYNTALGFLKHSSDAEEITQDILVKIYQSADSFQSKSKISTWVYKITVNNCLDRLRKRDAKRCIGSDIDSIPIEDHHIEGFDHPGVQLENRENARLLFKVIDQLPINQRTAFTLSLVEGLPRQEVAEIMEISLKGIESLLQRAKQNLRKELEKHFPDRRK